jgi:hypothetical protein
VKRILVVTAVTATVSGGLVNSPVARADVVCDYTNAFAQKLCLKTFGGTPCTGDIQSGRNGEPIYNPPGCDPNVPVPEENGQ